MAIPSNKEELINAIEINYAQLKKAIAAIDTVRTKEKTMQGHAKDTTMSICDLLAYLIGWQKLLFKWEESFNQNKIPDLPETNFKWTELGKLAQKFYKDFEHLNFEELQLALDAITAKTLKHLNNCSNEELYTVLWYKKYTKGRMIQINTASPFRNAKIRIRKWLKTSA